MTIHHNIVAQYLRTVFKREWDLAYPHMSWNDDNISLDNFVNLEKNTGKARKALKNSGDRNSWDLTTLFFVLLYSDSLAQKLKNLPSILSYYTAIDTLRQSRNAISHPSPSTYLNKEDFQHKCNEICNCLRDLGFPEAKDDINDVVDQQNPSQDEKDPPCCGDTNCKCKTIGFECRQNCNITFNQFFKTMVFLVFVVAILAVLHMVLNRESKLETDSMSKKHTLEKRDNSRPSTFYFPEPLKPHFFVGRKNDLNNITKFVLKRHFKSVVSVVGPPGVGKTALSIAVGEHLRDQHGYGVAYANLGKAESLPVAFKKVVSSLGYPHMKKDALYDMYISKRVLLVLDDIDFALKLYAAELKEILIKLISLNEITILTTSRIEYDMLDYDSMTHKVQPLDKDDSLKLLHQLHPTITPKHAKIVASEVDGSPLMLEMAGHQLRAGIYSMHEFEMNATCLAPGNLSQYQHYFFFLEVLLSNSSTELKREFVGFAMDIDTQNDKSKQKSLSILVNLGLLKVSSTTGHVKYEMHNVVKEFAEYIGGRYDYLVQYDAILPLESLPMVSLLGLIVHLLGRLLAEKGKEKVIKPFVKMFYLVLAIIIGAQILEYNYRPLTSKNGVKYRPYFDLNSIILYLAGVILVIVIHSIICVFRQRCKLKSAVYKFLCWVLCCSAWAVTYYGSSFMLTHRSSKDSIEKFTRHMPIIQNPMNNHIISCCIHCIITIMTPAAIYSSSANKMLAQLTGYHSSTKISELVKYVSTCFIICTITQILWDPLLQFLSSHFPDNELDIMLNVGCFQMIPIHYFLFFSITQYMAFQNTSSAHNVSDFIYSSYALSLTLNCFICGIDLKWNSYVYPGHPKSPYPIIVFSCSRVIFLSICLLHAFSKRCTKLLERISVWVVLFLAIFSYTYIYKQYEHTICEIPMIWQNKWKTEL